MPPVERQGQVDLQRWQQAMLESLEQGGPVCQHAAQYIRERNVRIGFARQSTGARWTLSGKIELNPRYYPPEAGPVNPYLLGAIVHEATHLEQGIALALTVWGEVGGWRADYRAVAELHAPIQNVHWQTVAATPEPPTDDDLRRARRAMLAMAGWRYLVWLLPLRPNWWTRLLAWMAGLFSGKGKRA
ncbi:MAG: hypothetical protein N2508_02690 [Anaerolineae bacterium]|nr:hypothetical protein [Anaerolineae bacterium]